eukprot:9485982-Alexandrium_andersonii.AAC.1
MSASLVGSEMCIRDRTARHEAARARHEQPGALVPCALDCGECGAPARVQGHLLRCPANIPPNVPPLGT